MIASYSLAQISRVPPTINALPGAAMNGCIARRRASQCATMSAASAASRCRRAVHGVDHRDALLDAEPARPSSRPDGGLVGGLSSSSSVTSSASPTLISRGSKYTGTVAPSLDRAGQVVDVDVVAEDGLGVAVGEGDRRAGEGDQGRVRQGVAEVAGVAVEVVVVAAVRLVDDDDDVASVRQQRMVGTGLAFVFS